MCMCAMPRVCRDVFWLFSSIPIHVPPVPAVFNTGKRRAQLISRALAVFIPLAALLWTVCPIVFKLFVALWCRCVLLLLFLVL